MNKIIVWVGVIGLGGLFAWFMFYSFYLVLFSKNGKEDVLQKETDSGKDAKNCERGFERSFQTKHHFN